MRFISLFAGVGGFDLGMERAGMECALQVEIDKHARAVLRERWPDVPKLEDVHDVVFRPGPERQAEGYGPNDMGAVATADATRAAGDLPNEGGTNGAATVGSVHLVCGGFPCQDYSVAGTRSGLAGDRGALWWEFHRIVAEFKPTWVVGENVPGLLSSAGGRDFRTIIGSLVQLGYGVTWAVLDSQYFGVAQRRRRLFIVAHSGGEPRPEILALSEGLFGHPAPSREAGEGVAPTVTGGPPYSRTGNERIEADALALSFDRAAFNQGQNAQFKPQIDEEQTGALVARGPHGVLAKSIDFQNTATEDEICGTLQAEAQRRRNRGHGVITLSSGQVNAEIGEDVAPTLNLNDDGAPIAFHPRQDPIHGPITPASEASGPHGVLSFRENQRGEVKQVGDGDVVQSLSGGGGKPGQGYPAILHAAAGFSKYQERETATPLRAVGHKGTDVDLVTEPVQVQWASGGGKVENPTAQALRANAEHNYQFVRQMAVPRRLTPLECERLQAFPDHWTEYGVDDQGKRYKMSDTQRYKQMGNAVTMNVIAWIGERIAKAHNEEKK